MIVLHKLELADEVTTIPTVGINVETVAAEGGDSINPATALRMP